MSPNQQPSPPPLNAKLPPSSPQWPSLPELAEQADREDPDLLVDHLNTRFEVGHASEDVFECGVLVHQVDSLDDGRDAALWEPCPRRGEWCSPYSDRMAATMINAKLPFLYSHDSPGFILSEDVSIRCSFPRDGNSMAKVCDEEDDEDECVPGCFTHGAGCKDHGESCYESMKSMIEAHEKHHQANNQCVPKGQHDPSNLCQYNEVVLDGTARRWKAKLPRIIDAVFFPAGKGEHLAREIHADFLKAYKLNAMQVPLVKLDLSRSNANARPFVLVATPSKHKQHDDDDDED